MRYPCRRSQASSVVATARKCDSAGQAHFACSVRYFDTFGLGRPKVRPDRDKYAEVIRQVRADGDSYGEIAYVLGRSEVDVRPISVRSARLKNSRASAYGWSTLL